MNLFRARRNGAGRARLPRTLPPQRRPVCPSCRAPITGIPRNGDLCAKCGSRYYLRRKPNSPTAFLLSAAQAAAFDANAPRSTQQAAGPVGPGQPAAPAPASQGPASTRNPLDGDKRRFNWVWVHGTAEGQWRQLKRNLTLHARDGNWLLYRNARFEMAEVRRKQDRLLEALELYLEVWYLDLNGPRDCWGVSGVRRLYEDAPFQPADGMTTPLVARWVIRIAERLFLDAPRLERQFTEIATRLYQSMNLPLTPREAWTIARRDVAL